MTFNFKMIVCVLGLSSASCFGQGNTQPNSQATPSTTSGQQVDKPSNKSQVPASGKASATTNVNSAQVKTEHAVANKADLPPVVPGGRPVIGVALEGGGALGLAHIGVLKWMEENRIPVDRLSGTSMGALVGALYATGRRSDELERLATSNQFEALFYLRSPYNQLSYRRREDEHDFPQIFTLGLKGGPSFRNAFVSDSGLNDFLDLNFSRYNSTDLSFDVFPIPFRCVATDLNTLEPVVFEGGPLPQAIRSSISIPGVFSPVAYHDHYLVDGAVTDNLPTDIVRQDLHSDIVIGVHLVSASFKEGDVSSVTGVLSRAFSAGSALNERISEKLADILIQVDTSKFGVGDYDKGLDLIKAGYSAAAKNADELRRYSLSEADWALYLESRESRIRPKPSVLQVVKVEGDTPAARSNVEYEFRKLEQKPMDPVQVEQSMHRITGNGNEQATYETYQPQGSGPPSATNGVAGQQPDTGIRVDLSPVRRGPPFLDVGLDASAATSNVSRTTLDLRLLNTGLGGYGSELRTDVRLGFLTQVASEYYHQLTRSGYFFQLQGGVLRQPVYLWQNQQRISEHLQQQAGGGVQLGRTFNRYFQSELDYENQVVRWHPVLGFDGTAPVSGTAQTATAHLKIDTTLSGLSLAQNGIRMELRAGALLHTVASQNAPLVEFSLRKPFRISNTQSAYISINADSYFRRNVTEPLRFTIGGPLRLSASSVNEFRGTDTYLMRAGYTHKVSSLPSGLGQGVYLAGGYEAAEIWSPERRAFVRQDGLVTLIGVFPIGDLTLGGAVGDAGRRKIFVTFGRLF